MRACAQCGASIEERNRDALHCSRSCAKKTRYLRLRLTGEHRPSPAPYSPADQPAKRRWEAANRHKRAAYLQVRYAVKRGELAKEPCLFCGAERVEAHHHDYTQPLSVTWLCSAHHRRIHRTVPT